MERKGSESFISSRLSGKRMYYIIKGLIDKGYDVYSFDAQLMKFSIKQQIFQIPSLQPVAFTY